MKKDEGRFTLQFNMRDPKEASAAKELNRYRHKAPFVAQAVWHYMNRSCREETGISREELRQTVIDIVKEYLKENTLAVIPENMEPKKELQKLDRETATSLKSSLSAFRRK